MLQECHKRPPREHHPRPHHETTTTTVQPTTTTVRVVPPPHHETSTTVVQIGTAVALHRCQADGLVCTVEHDTGGSIGVYGTLPNTGASTVPLAFGGVLLVAVGLLLIRKGR